MTDFEQTRTLFHLPENTTYLDGNSLGPLPKTASAAVAAMMENEWGELLIRGWNDAGWMNQPARIGDSIARLIGAPSGSVVMGDTLSIKVYQALAAALQLRPKRQVILSDTGNFPTDLYMAKGLLKLLGDQYSLKLVEPSELENAIDETIAVVLATEVDYRSGRLHNMQRITAKAHSAGALTVWDLAHSAGAIPVDLEKCCVDFAIGCTYKYLNSGPGGPAFIYVSREHIEQIEPVLSGWLGHDRPFDFDLEYQAGVGIERMRVGTPPILQLASLGASLEIWAEIDMTDLRARSIELSTLFIELVESSSPDLVLASPRDPRQRGSQISFAFEHGYAVMQALIAQGVIGDFRAPNIMRFGITPLYTNETDIRHACAVLAEILSSSNWDQPQFHQRSVVT